MEDENTRLENTETNAVEKLRSWEQERTQHSENIGGLDTGEITEFEWVENSLDDDRFVFIIEAPDGAHIEYGFSIPEDKRANNPRLDAFLSQLDVNKRTVQNSVGTDVPLLYGYDGWTVHQSGQYSYAQVGLRVSRFFRKHRIYRYQFIVLWISLLFIGLTAGMYTSLRTVSNAILLASALSLFISFILPSSASKTGEMSG